SVKFLSFPSQLKRWLLMIELKFKTELLKDHLDHLQKRYDANQPPEHMSDKHFFLEMKESTQPIYDLLEEWEKEALDFIKQRKLNVHPHQIRSTKENMELLILHSYYVDARKKRYMELNQS